MITKLYRCVLLSGAAAVVASMLAQPASADRSVEIDGTDGTGRYYLSRLNPRAFVYSDREYVFSRVPGCLFGKTYLVTPNKAKFSRGDELVRMYASRPINIYLGYDSRYQTRPDWIEQGYDRTDDEMTVSDPRSSRNILRFDLWHARFPEGDFVLGGNLAPREQSNFGMYTAVIVPVEDDNCR